MGLSFALVSRPTTILVILLLVVSACSGSTSQPTTTSSAAPDTTTSSNAPTTVATTTTTTAAPSLGAEWASQPLDITVRSMIAIDDTLWVSGLKDDGAIALTSTTDGETWNSVDLANLGIPVGTEDDPVGYIVLGEVDGRPFGISNTGAGGVSPGDGLLGTIDIWVLRMADDGAWVAEGPDVTGIDQHPRGPKNWLVLTVSGVYQLGPHVVAPGRGKWWAKYDTVDGHFMALRLTDGAWHTEPRGINEDFSWVFGGPSVGNEDQVVFVGSAVMSEGSTFISYATTDGVTWEPSMLDQVEHTEDAPRGVAMGPDGTIVAVGTNTTTRSVEPEALTPTAYVSSDGIAWERISLPTNGEDRDPIDVVWTGTEFLVFGQDDAANIRTLWTSPDGRDWTATEIENEILWAADNPHPWSPDTNAAFFLSTVWQNKLVVASGDGIAFSPIP